MSAAALNLLMMNFNNQMQQETELQHVHQAPGAAMQNFMPSSYPPHQLQQHQQYHSHQGMENQVLSPNGSPVRQLKRLHPGATNTATELLRCRRRIELSQAPYGYTMPARQVSSVARRNERERNRVRLVNHGFALLRQHVPSTATRSKKMSKVDTLKAAVDYIQQLRDLLEDADATVEAQTTTTSHLGDAGSLSPASSSGASSCADGSSSPGGYSSDDGASSTCGPEMLSTMHRMQEERHLSSQYQHDDDNDLRLEDFASWFC